jgi:hypothetical protein
MISARTATKRKRIAAELDLLGEAAVAYSLASRKFGGGDALAYDVEMYARLELSRASHAYADALHEANAPSPPTRSRRRWCDR